MIVKDWIMYKTSDLQKAIKIHNEKLVPTKEHDLPVKKAYILSRTLNEFGDYRYKYKHLYAYVSEIEAKKDDLTLEYNTLKKAKIFYDAKGVGLDDSFKNAFEIWQKRLIMSDTYFKIHTILFNPGFKTGEPHYNHAQDKNFIIKDYFDQKVIYHEIRQSLLCVEFEPLKTLELLNKIKNKKFNYFNINVKEFDDLVVENNKTCLVKNWDAYSLILRGSYEDKERMTNESINCLFEYYVKSTYSIHKLCRYNHIDNMSENLKWGFGFDKKLVFNGFKQVLLTHQTTVDKYLEDRPDFCWYGNSLHAKYLCHNNKTLIFPCLVSSQMLKIIHFITILNAITEYMLRSDVYKNPQYFILKILIKNHRALIYAMLYFLKNLEKHS